MDPLWDFPPHILTWAQEQEQRKLQYCLEVSSASWYEMNESCEESAIIVISKIMARCHLVLEHKTY